MQRKTKKIFDILRIIISVILLILMILCLTTNKDNYYAIYWIIVPVLLVCETYYLYKINGLKLMNGMLIKKIQKLLDIHLMV